MLNKFAIAGGAEAGASACELRRPGAAAAMAPVRSATASLPDGAEQLAAALEARTIENHHGEHLCVKKWFSEAIGHDAPDGQIDRGRCTCSLQARPKRRAIHRSGCSSIPKRRG